MTLKNIDCTEIEGVRAVWIPDIKADIIKTVNGCKTIIGMKIKYVKGSFGTNGAVGKHTDKYCYESKTKCERCKALMEWAGVKEEMIK